MKKEAEKIQAGRLATGTEIGAAAILAATVAGMALLVWAGRLESKYQLFILYGVIALTFGLMAVLYWVGDRIGLKRPQCLRWLCSQWLALAAAVLVFAVGITFLAVKHIFAGVSMSVEGKTACGCFAVACAIFAVVMYRAILADMGEEKPNLAGRLVIAGASFAALAVICIYSYVPNIINRPFFEQYHYSTVTHSLYNVSFSVPFTEGTSSLYGHYALFFWPILKLFGHGPRRVTLLLVGCNAITEAAYIYLILKLTKNTALRGLLIFASGYFRATTAGTVYAAVYPTRVLWPMLILAYIVWSCDHVTENSPHRRQYIYIIGYALCGLAVTWNFDSGLIAAVVYTAYIWVLGWKDNKVFSKEMFKVYALTVCGCVGAVAEMIVVVNLYNLLCGGPLIFRDCFFPLLSPANASLSQLLRTGMYQAGLDWLTPVCVFIVTEGLGLFRMCVRRRFDAKTVMLVCFPLMGLGQSYYYFNRSIAGWKCINYYLFLCLGLLALMLFTARHKTGLYHRMKQACGSAALFVVCMYALNLTIGAKDIILPSIEGGWNSMDSLHQAAAEASEIVPEGTCAFGICTQELCALMDRDPLYHQRDSVILMMMQFGADEDTFSEIRAQDRLLIHNYDAGALKTQNRVPILVSGAAEESDGAGFVKVAEFPAGNPIFWYMEKMEPAGVVAEQTDFSLEGDANLKLAYLPVTIKENTVYKVELTLAGDVSAAALANLIVDFVGPNYDRAEQEASSFVQDGVPAYTFYFNTGTFGAETMDCLARVFLHGMDSPVDVSAFRITEMARVQ